MKLDTWMRTNGISNREMARRLDTTPVSVWRYRRWPGKNSRKPQLETALAISFATQGDVKPEDWAETEAGAS